MSDWELILHAGFQQTGVTMLQRALGRVRPQLRRRGVGLVSHAALTQLDALAGWEADAACDPQAISAFDRELAGLVQDEAAEVDRRSRHGVRAIVVSSDHLLGRGNVDSRDGRPFRPRAEPAVAQAVRATGASRARLVLYTRRQDRLMEFCYLRKIQNGASHALGEQFPDRFEPLLDYGELVQRLAGVARVAEVRARPFELVSWSAARYVDDFLATLGLDGQLDLTPVGTDLTPYRMYSRRALHMALDVNEFLESEPERRMMRRFLKTHFPGTDDDSTRVIPASERARILDAYASANRNLFERWMPDLPADAYASDEATHELAATGRPRSAGAPRRHPVAMAQALNRRAVPAARALRRRAANPRTALVVVSRPECGGPWLERMVRAALRPAAGRDARGPVRVVSAPLGDTPLSRFLVRCWGRGLRRSRLGGRARRVVVVVRHPRDAIVARTEHGKDPENGRPATRTDLAGDPAGGLEWLLAAYDAWAEARRQRPEEVMLVRYEDLAEDAETVVRRVLEFAGVAVPGEQALQEAVAASADGREPFGAPVDAAVLPAEGREPGEAERAASQPGQVGISVESFGDDVGRINEAIGRSPGAVAFGYGPDAAQAPERARSRAAETR